MQVREGEAPSYFNAVEATVLVELVQGLLASTPKAGGRGVEPDDLGVMATYRKQVRIHSLHLAKTISISRGLSRYSPMSEVFAPRYLAGLVSTHGQLRSRHLCQTPLNGGEAYPVRTWPLSWNRAIQIQNTNIHTARCCAVPCMRTARGA